MSVLAHEAHGHHDSHHEEHAHHEEHFVSKYIFSQDHKMIARQYLITAVFMGFVGMLLSILFRIQLAWEKVLIFFLSSWVKHGLLTVS